MKKKFPLYTCMYVYGFLKSLQFFGALSVPFYLHRLGFDYTRMFAVETLFSVLLFLFEVPTGVIADVFGRKISLFLGSLLFGSSFIVYGFTHSFAVLLLIQFPAAIGFSLISGADRALLYELAKAEGKRDTEITSVTARYDAAGTAAMFIAFPAGSLFADSGLLAYNAALGAVFVITAAAIILSGFIALAAKETGVRRKQIEKGSQGMRIKTYIRHGVAGFAYIFQNKTLLGFSINYAVVSAFTFLIYWFYQPLLLNNSVPVGVLGIVAACFNATAMLVLLTIGFVQKKLGVRRILFLTACLPGVLYITAGLFQGYTVSLAVTVSLIAIFGITALRSFRSPLLTVLMNEQIENTNRATVLSGVSMIERIIIALLYPLAGILSDISLPMTLVVLGILTLGSAFAMQKRL